MRVFWKRVQKVFPKQSEDVPAQVPEVAVPENQPVGGSEYGQGDGTYQKPRSDCKQRQIRDFAFIQKGIQSQIDLSENKMKFISLKEENENSNNSKKIN